MIAFIFLRKNIFISWNKTNAFALDFAFLLKEI